MSAVLAPSWSPVSRLGSMPIDRDALTARQSYISVVAGVVLAIAGIYSFLTASASYLYVGAVIMLIAAVVITIAGIRGLRALARLRGEGSS